MPVIKGGITLGLGASEADKKRLLDAVGNVMGLGEPKKKPEESPKKEKPKKESKPKPKKESKKKSILSRIKDMAEDLLDDGKRNYSNDPSKKSPGRKKKKKE